MDHFSQLLAVSADPWTHGHEDLRRKAGKGVLVGIADNPKKSYAFAKWERLRLAQQSMKNVDPNDVRIISGSGALYMKENCIPTLVRGCRNAIDAAEEATLRFFYRHELPGIVFNTIHSNPDSPVAEISSSGVKESLRVGHDISKFVTSRTKQALESRIIRQYSVGITGEMGSGKSYVAAEIRKISDQYAIPCLHVDMDTIAHDIYTLLGEPIYQTWRQKLSEAFGASILLQDGYIDRAALAVIFRDDESGEKKEKLNSIMREPILHRYTKIILGKEGIILTDNALLAEFNLSHLSNHHSVLVQSDPRTRMNRVKARYLKRGRDMSESDIEKMFAAQLTKDEKRNVLEAKVKEENNGSITDVDNSENVPLRAREIFFGMLRNIDISGELRAGIILNLLWVSEFEREECIADLKKKHEESHRRYHTWESIIEMLDLLFEHTVSISDDELATLGGAILFQYSVYVVDRVYYKNNKTRSAGYAKEMLEKYHVKKGFVDEIYALIGTTSEWSWMDMGDNELAFLLHDFDLGILGSTRERYRLYVKDIVDELWIYANKDFKVKRIELLTGFKNDKNLYKTDMGREKFLKSAKRNIGYEIGLLSN